MIVLYGSLVFACLWFGVCQAKRLSIRCEFFAGLCKFLKLYEENLSFKQENLKTLIKNFCADNEGEFKVFLENLVIKDKDVQVEGLTTKEVFQVKEIILSLGKSDQQTESQIIKHLEFLASEMSEKAKATREKYSSLSIKLSLLIGLILVVLLL